MRLLIRSMLRHLRGHLLQTAFTVIVTVLVTGMLSVLLYFSSGFRNSLKTYALEKNGTYHYKYYTNAGTGVAEMLRELAEQFRKDDWFADVEFTEDGSQAELILTVAHPGVFTSKIMAQKFNTLKERYYPVGTDEVFYLGLDHNYELLAASFDLSRENGIYSFLLVFLLLLATISAAAILTLGALFRLSAMQRERELALLAGIGADRKQIVGMMLLESGMYCLVSIPTGLLFGIWIYRRIQIHFDNVIYSLLRFPPAELRLSVPCFAILTGCAACVILLSGLQSALKASRVRPMELLQRTKEIRVPKQETKHGSSPGNSIYEIKTAAKTERWLAKKSQQRFRRRNKPILVMLTVTFALCFIWDGFRQYSTQAAGMSFDLNSCNYSIDLYGNDQEEVTAIATALEEASDNRLKASKTAIFYLREPYPFSAFGESALRANNGMLPDVSLICVRQAEFDLICDELAIPVTADGLWGIFLDTECSFWSDGVKIKGKPFYLETGKRICLYNSPEPDTEIFPLTIAGVYDTPLPFQETAIATRMSILVPERVFAELEQKRRNLEREPGMYHFSLRGNIEDGEAFGRIVAKQTAAYENITCIVTDSAAQLRREMAGIDSFQFLCGILIGTFVMISICGNFTVSWSACRAREREFAVLLSVGMTPGNLQRMRLLELFRNVESALLPGLAAGMCIYQLIYLIYASEYQIRWQLPSEGFLLGIASLAVAMGTVEIALRIGLGKKNLAEQLRSDE